MPYCSIILPSKIIINKTTTRITRYFRISRIILHTFTGLFIASVLLPLASKSYKKRFIKWWCKHLLTAFNIRVVSYGHVPASDNALTGMMIIANHVSWSDIHALNSMVPLRFIAKAEIKSWPIFGFLATQANALFIDRTKRHDAARIIEATVQSLKNGDNLCLFPEGTTTEGNEIKPFKGSLIQAAIHAKAIVWPVAIRYPDANGSTNTKMAYAGKTTLPEAMRQALFQQSPVVELHFLDPIYTSELTDKDRRSLTLHLHQLISKKLGL